MQANGPVVQEKVLVVQVATLVLSKRQVLRVVLEAPNSTWEIQTTQEKGLFPQISSGLRSEFCRSSKNQHN